MNLFAHCKQYAVPKTWVENLSTRLSGQTLPETKSPLRKGEHPYYRMTKFQTLRDIQWVFYCKESLSLGREQAVQCPSTSLTRILGAS